MRDRLCPVDQRRRAGALEFHDLLVLARRMVAEHDDVRAVVLTHTPPVFCAGADLKERASGTADAQSAGNPMADAIVRLGSMRAVSIAAVDGRRATYWLVPRADVRR